MCRKNNSSQPVTYNGAVKRPPQILFILPKENTHRKAYADIAFGIILLTGIAA
jgi:hypothetical protein